MIDFMDDIKTDSCIQIQVVSKGYWYAGHKYLCYETEVDGSDNSTL